MNCKTKIIVSLLFVAKALFAQQPNIVWITSEDNSIHYMKLFDDDGIETPNIEKLATQGITFNHAFSNTPVCSAARSTLITGVYGPKLASHYHRSENKIRLPNSIKMFPEYLRDAGYYTCNNSKEDYNITKSENVWNDSSKNASWKNRNTNQPFFYVHNIHTTHEGQIHFNNVSIDSVVTKNLTETIFVQPNYPRTEIFEYTSAYYRDLVQKMDAEVGNVINDLKDDGLLDHTIIFYFSDHGGVLPNSKGYLKETGLHVPLVVYFPEKYKDLSPFKMGTSSDTFVSFVDFSATVLNLSNIKIPSTMDGTPFLGKNVFNTHPKNEVTYGYADRFDEKYDMVRSLRQGRFKYIRNFQPFNIDALMNNYRYKQLAYQEWKHLFDTGKLNSIQSSFFKPKLPEELYDIENDPFETKNLANNPLYQDQLNSLRTLLTHWIEKMPDLSFYPEFHLIQHAFKNPLRFGKRHKKDISKYLSIANLQLESYQNAKPLIVKHLNSRDDLERYWALIVASSFGIKAKDLNNDIKVIANEDRFLINKVRAAEFLVFTGDYKNIDIIIDALYQSKNSKEALLILNSITLLHDFYSKLDVYIDTYKIDKTVITDTLVLERLKYLNSL